MTTPENNQPADHAAGRRKRRQLRAARMASQRSGSSVGHVNVTPMIDVVMCLIIFYLIVGRLVLERRGQVDLPEASSGEVEDPAEQPVVVAIRDNTDLRVDGEAVAPAGSSLGLRQLLAQRLDGRSVAVQVRASRDLPYADVRPVLDACRAAGATQLQLVASKGAGDAAIEVRSPGDVPIGGGAVR